MVRFRKFIALSTTLFFFLQDIAWAAPGLSPFAGLRSPEVTLPRLEIEVPEEFGKVASVYQSPESLSYLIHIQDAHGNYEAQKNIERLVRHLTQTYKIKLLFLEAANEPLEPSLFHFFKNPDLNLKLADLLMHHGEFTGPEYFLLEESLRPSVILSEAPEGAESKDDKGRASAVRNDRRIQAYGIEDTHLYRRDLKLFRRILRNHEKARPFLEKLQGILQIRESKTFSRDLRSFVREWRLYQGEDSDLKRFIEALSKESQRSLFLDLKDPLHQSQYPSLTRLLKLRDLEKGLDPEKIREEKESLLSFLQGKIDPELLTQFKELDLGKKPTQPYPRFLFERIYEAMVIRAERNAASKGLAAEQTTSSVILSEAKNLHRRSRADGSGRPDRAATRRLAKPSFDSAPLGRAPLS